METARWSEDLSELDGDASDAKVDESRFARVTADLIFRERNAPLFGRGSPSSEVVKAESSRNRFLGSASELFAYKGEAKGTAIAAPTADSGIETDAIAAPKQDDEELHRLRDELAALKSALADSEAALAKAGLDHEQARESWQQAVQAAEVTHEQSKEQSLGLNDELAALRSALADREAALAKAMLDFEQARESWRSESETPEHDGKAAEAARLADAEAQWREQSALTLAEVQVRAEAARVEAEQHSQKLRDESDALRSALADREAALAKAMLDHEQARNDWRSESETLEQDWKAAEAVRLADAEAQWREQSALALAEVQARTDAARIEAEQHSRKLHDELATLRSALADREAALVTAASEHKQARQSWQQETQALISKAEQSWKAAEAVRLTTAEAKWLEHSAEALAAVKAEADETVRGLEDRLAALQTTLADRDAALAKVVSETEHARQRAQQDLQTALANAKARESGEAARLAAAEAAWRQQSASALNEATARYQAAEGMLVQLRMQADQARSASVGGSIKGGGARSTFGGRPAEREPDAAAIRLPTREERSQDSRIVIGTKPMTVEPETRAPGKRSSGRDILMAAAVAVVAIVAYPSVEPLLPENLRSSIAAVTSTFGSTPNVAPRPAIVVSDVNLREGPSTAAKVIVTLPRGQKVTAIERRGDWTLVQIQDDNSGELRGGWVFSSLLEDEPGDIGNGDDVTPSTEAE